MEFCRLGILMLLLCPSCGVAPMSGGTTSHTAPASSVQPTSVREIDWNRLAELEWEVQNAPPICEQKEGDQTRYELSHSKFQEWFSNTVNGVKRWRRSQPRMPGPWEATLRLLVIEIRVLDTRAQRLHAGEMCCKNCYVEDAASASYLAEETEDRLVELFHKSVDKLSAQEHQSLCRHIPPELVKRRSIATCKLVQ